MSSAQLRVLNSSTNYSTGLGYSNAHYTSWPVPVRGFRQIARDEPIPCDCGSQFFSRFFSPFFFTSSPRPAGLYCCIFIIRTVVVLMCICTALYIYIYIIRIVKFIRNRHTCIRTFVMSLSKYLVSRTIIGIPNSLGPPKMFTLQH